MTVQYLLPQLNSFPTQFISPLRKLLQSKDSDVVNGVLEILRVKPSILMVFEEDLIPLLQNESVCGFRFEQQTIRVKLLEILCSSKDPLKLFEPHFLKGLDDSDYKFAQYCAINLVHMKNKTDKTKSLFIDIFHNKTERKIVFFATRTLKELGKDLLLVFTEQEILKMLESYKEKKSFSRFGLGSFVEVFSKLGEKAKVFKPKLKYLMENGNLRGKRSSSGLSIDIAVILTQIDPEDHSGIEFIKENISTPPPHRSYLKDLAKAIRKCGKLAPLGIPELKLLLKEKETRVQIEAATSLQILDSNNLEGFKNLLRIWKTSFNWYEKLYVLKAFGEIGQKNPEVLKLLEKALKNPNKELSLCARRVYQELIQ